MIQTTGLRLPILLKEKSIKVSPVEDLEDEELLEIHSSVDDALISL